MAAGEGRPVSNDIDLETGDDGDFPDLPDFDTSTTAEATTEAIESTGGASRRLVGLLALLLGALGVLLALVMAFLSIRLLFTASGTVDRAMEPVVVAFDRLDERIDQTDELVGRDGVDPERVPELQARVDGLVDVSTNAHQVFEAVDDHALYRFLPASLSDLGDALEDFEGTAVTIDETLADGTTIRASAAQTASDQIDGMQSRVADVRGLIDDAASSLRRWLRIGGLLGFLVSLWGVWAQSSLARRGWRGFRGRAL